MNYLPAPAEGQEAALDSIFGWQVVKEPINGNTAHCFTSRNYGSGAGAMAQLVKYLLRKCEGLNSTFT